MPKYKLRSEFKIKTWRAIAFLAVTLAFTSAAEALNLTIGNSVATGTSVPSSNLGQSFVNDPSGSGRLIRLNTWTISFVNAANQTTALGTVLNIRAGIGNGGTLVGASSTTATSTFGLGNSVTWTFTGGLEIADNVTYTAVLATSLSYVGNAGVNPNPAYPNGIVTLATVPLGGVDLVFQGTFSEAEPIPFEFEPSFGILLLGGVWAGNRALKKFKARN